MCVYLYKTLHTHFILKRNRGLIKIIFLPFELGIQTWGNLSSSLICLSVTFHAVSLCPAVMYWSFIFITLPSFFTEGLNSTQEIRSLWFDPMFFGFAYGAVCVCGSIDFYADFHVGCSTLWALYVNTNTTSLKVCLLSLRLRSKCKITHNSCLTEFQAQSICTTCK